MLREQTNREVEPVLFSFEEAARLLGGLSPWTLRRHAQRGNIHTVKLGQRVFLDAGELDRIRREGLPRLGPTQPSEDPAELST